MKMPMEDWIRGCVYHDGRKGEVTLPTDKVLEIADYIQEIRTSVAGGMIELMPEDERKRTMKELKPCPFCGSDKVETETDDEGISWHIFCYDCGVICGYAVSEDKVVEAWNRRTESEE